MDSVHCTTIQSSILPLDGPSPGVELTIPTNAVKGAHHCYRVITTVRDHTIKEGNLGKDPERNKHIALLREKRKSTAKKATTGAAEITQAKELCKETVMDQCLKCRPEHTHHTNLTLLARIAGKETCC